MNAQWQKCCLCEGSGSDPLLGSCGAHAKPCPVCGGARIIETPPTREAVPANRDIVAEISLLISRLNQWEPTLEVREAQAYLTSASHEIRIHLGKGRVAG